MDDANFEHTTANGAILRLTRELAWIGGASENSEMQPPLGAPIYTANQSSLCWQALMMNWEHWCTCRGGSDGSRHPAG